LSNLIYYIYYKHAGRIHGPIEVAQIRKLVQLGQTTSSDLWSTDGITWNPIDSLESDLSPNQLPPTHSMSPYSFGTDAPSAFSNDEPLTRENRDQPQPFPNVQSAFPLKFLLMGGSILIGILFVFGILLFLRPDPQRPPEEDFGAQGGQIPNAKGQQEGQPKAVLAPNGRPASKEFLEKYGKSVALIRRTTDTGQVIGSGFLFKAGYLLTTAEIAGDDRGILISVVFPAGDADERGPHQARIHHHDPATGIAILRLDAPQLPIPMSGAGLLKAGEEIFLLASPGFSAPREPINLELANASYLTTITKKDLEFHRISMRTKPSQAGAPILDAKGTAVGMIASPITPDDPLCITSRQILKILKDVNLP